jgi:hypothetical protein
LLSQLHRRRVRIWVQAAQMKNVRLFKKIIIIT